jgi:hypothetical protein
MTLIGIGCLKPADTNNDFLYRLVIVDTNNNFLYQLATVDTKKTLFFISYKWYRPDRLIPKILYHLILQSYSVVVYGSQTLL